MDIEFEGGKRVPADLLIISYNIIGKQMAGPVSDFMSLPRSCPIILMLLWQLRQELI